MKLNFEAKHGTIGPEPHALRCDSRNDLIAGEGALLVLAGAFVDLLKPYEALRLANVCSVLDVIRLARTGARKALHFFSTTDVLGADSPYERARPPPLLHRWMDHATMS